MKRHIHLRDLTCDTPPCPRYPKHFLVAARELMVKRDLRSDNATGKIHDNYLGEVECFSNPSDHKPHICEEDVMRWEFSRHINNQAWRFFCGADPLPKP